MAKKKAVKKKPTQLDAAAGVTAKQKHYDEIREKNREFREAELEYHSAKLEAAELKKRRDRISGELCEVIARGPNPQMSLFDTADNNVQKKTVVVLGLADDVIDKLEDAGIATIGDLQRWWDSGKYLDEVKGLGPEKSASVADAFADYAKEHPEVYGDQE